MLEMIVGFHLYTQHFNTEAGYNNVNPGMYIAAKTETVCNPAGGYYFNSERKDSFWAGCMFEAGKDGQYRLIVGGVTGYKNQRVTPMLLPQYNIKIDDKAYFGVALIPPVKIADGGGLHFTLETRF